MNKTVATHVGNNRLLKLSAYLRQVPTKSFDMRHWIATTSEKYTWDITSYEFKVLEKVKDVNECGFAACAVGHACDIKAFRRAGLKMVYDHGVEPAFNDKTGYKAAADFFAISNDDARILFSPEYYAEKVQPKTVAKAIEKFVAKRQAEKESN